MRSRGRCAPRPPEINSVGAHFPALALPGRTVEFIIEKSVRGLAGREHVRIFFVILGAQ